MCISVLTDLHRVWSELIEKYVWYFRTDMVLNCNSSSRYATTWKWLNSMAWNS